MAGSVIDSLVVTLGLDSKGFAQGIKGSTDELASFTKRVAGMFFAVRGLEDVVGYFKDLHQQLAEVGFESRNLGVAGTELKRLGEVSQLFGGQVQDAADSIQSLQANVFNLRYRGQLSDSLIMLQRFGVAYLTASGHARNFRDIALDAAKAIDRQAKAAGLNQGERFQLAQSMGFTGGVASAVAQGGKGLEDALRNAQTDQRALTEKTIQGQVKLDQDVTRLQNVTAAQSSAILSKLTPAIRDMTQWLQKLANDLLPRIAKAIQSLIDFFKNPPPWLASILSGIKELAAALGPTGTLIAALGALTLAIGAGGALLGALGGLVTTLGGIGLAVAAGIAAGNAIAKLPSGGLLDKINEKLLDWFGPGSSEAEKNAIRSSGPSKGTIPRAPGARAALPPPTPTAPRQPGAAAQAGAPGTALSGTPTASIGGGGGTQVSIREVNINTSASSLTGVGQDLGTGLRKSLVANSDSGQG